jgi:Tripartite tricarboxylate transporter TctB family
MSLERSPSGGGSGRRMILRRDHVAGSVFVAGSAVLFALSGDLPFGTLSSPGAGMMPKLVLILLIGLGACLMLRAGESPPLADVAWADFVHALTIVAAATVAIGTYTVIGFIPSTFLLLFALIYIVERRNIWRALAVSICVTIGSYYVFNTLLKSPLPRMPFWP